MIVADDLGYGDASFTGVSEIQTPALDALRSEGIALENYYVQQVCSPTRAALLTGRYPMRYGLQSSFIPTDAAFGLNVNETIVPQLLGGDNGSNYRKSMVGKWHIGFCQWEMTPTFRGFDSFFGFYGGAEDYWEHTWPNEEFDSQCFGNTTGESGYCGVDLRWESEPLCGEGCSQVVRNESGHYSTHMWTEQALRRINEFSAAEEEEESSLFLYLTYNAVHEPDEAPEAYVCPYANTTDKKRRVFSGMLAALDEGVLNVTDSLKSFGLWDNTLFIFTTDNGGNIGTTPHNEDSTGSTNYPLRGGKYGIWEGGVRGVAFVGGGVVANWSTAGGSYAGLAHAVDFLPTILDAAGELQDGSSGEHQLDGHSLLSALRTNGPSPRAEEGVLIALDDNHPMAAFRRGDFKLMTGSPGPPSYYSNRTNPGAQQQSPPPSHDTAFTRFVDARDGTEVDTFLVNVTADIRETTDLSSEFPDVVQELLEAIDKFRSVQFPAYQMGGDPMASPDQHGGAWTPWLDQCN